MEMIETDTIQALLAAWYKQSGYSQKEGEFEF